KRKEYVNYIVEDLDECAVQTDVNVRILLRDCSRTFGGSKGVKENTEYLKTSPDISGRIRRNQSDPRFHTCPSESQEPGCQTDDGSVIQVPEKIFLVE